MTERQDLVFRLRERARIRRQIATRKSVIEGKADRISDLLEESATLIEDDGILITHLQSKLWEK